MVVQLFQRHHRQENVMFLEAEQAARVVHEHVGVEDEQLACCALAGGCFLVVRAMMRLL